MKLFVIVVRRSSAFFQQRLEQKSVCLNNLALSYSWRDCGKSGKTLYLLGTHPATGAIEREAVIALIASLASQFIIFDLKDALLHDLLRYHYFYFRREERDEIMSLALRRLKDGIPGLRQETFREVIERKIKHYLQEQGSHLNIEGFLQFRLQDYRQEMRKVIDEAVENYLTEKEYREFVRLLKYFLEIQQPKIDLVHLAVDDKGQFQITDHSFKKIDPRDWEEFDLDDFEEDTDYEDILVSMLVSVAPRQIMLHQNVLPRYPRAVETLRRIFDKRLLYCRNCSYCRQDELTLIGSDKNKV